MRTQTPGPAERRCLDAIRSGAHTKTAVALSAKLDLRRAVRAIDRLIGAGLVEAAGRQDLRMTRQGQAVLDDASTDEMQSAKDERPRAPRLGPTAYRLLDLLDRPRRGADLADALGVTRQRVHQLIVKLAALDLVRLGDGRHPMHAVARGADASALLNLREERLLSALPPGRSTTPSRIGAAAALDVDEVLALVPRLIEAGLIDATTGPNRQVLYGLTPVGAAHWQRTATARQAEPPSLPVRSDRIRDVLSVFAAHGPTRTIEVGRALGISQSSINALMQYLKRKGLVCKAGDAQTAPHDLTEAGRATLDQMRRG